MEAARDPHSIVFEVEYWQAMLGDVSTLNNQVRDAAQSLASAPVALLEMLSLMLDPRRDPRPATERVNAAIRETMNGLAKMGEPIERLLDLSHGRLMALREEAGLPPLPDPDEDGEAA